jgi:hypothetical protein
VALQLTTYYSNRLPAASDLPTAGLRLHLRPDEGHGRFLNADGTLAFLADHSGHDLVLTPDAGSSPLPVGPWAGGTGVYFDGRQALKPLDLGGPVPEVLTAVLMLQRESGASDIMPLHIGEGNNQDLWLSSNHFGLNTYNSDIYGIDQGDAALSQPVLVVVELHSSGPANFRLWLNAQAQDVRQQQSNTATRALESILRIGGNPGWLWRGWLGEMLFYDRPLAAAEHRDIYQTLRTRYPSLPAYQPARTTNTQAPTAAEVPAGPLAWWRAATGLTSQADGALLQWDDLSGAGHHLTPVKARPVLQNWAGSQALYLQGQQLNPIDLGSPVPEVLTAMLLLQREPGASDIMPLHIGEGNNQDLWLNSNHFGLNTYNGDIYGIDQANAILDQPVLMVVELHSSGPAQFSLWLNGQPQEVGQQQSNTATRALESIVRIGGNPGWLWRGWLGEILLYNRPLTNAEQAQLVTYVRGRYQVSF